MRLPALGLGCLLAAAGCGDVKPAPKPPPVTTEPAKQVQAPDVPDDFKDEFTAGETEVLVNADAAAPTGNKRYVQKPEHPSGTISGLCKFVKPPKARQPSGPQNLAEGPYAIKDRLDGEVEYYENIKIHAPSYMVRGRRRGQLFPSHVVLMIRDVKAGRRPPLMPAGFMAIHGYCKGLAGNYGARTNITFAALHTRATFFTYEAYPCTFYLTRAATGERVFEGRVSYKDKGRDRAKTVGGGREIWIASKPTPAQSPILREPGLYKVTTKRHPWKVGYLLLVDNPYAAVVRAGFEIRDVPVGRHRMDVWHPVFKPVKKTIEFEIVEDETTDVLIEFEPPAE